MTPAHRRVAKRSLKVGLAAALATWFSQLLHLPNPWFATVAAIVAMHSTIQSSFRNAGRAVFGSVIGAALGLAVAAFAKDQAWAVGFVVAGPLVGFGWFDRREIGEQAALVASVVVLVPALPELSTTQFAGVRLAQAVIGIAVALVVQSTVFPTRAHRKVRRELAGIYRDMGRLMGMASTALEDPPSGTDPRGASTTGSEPRTGEPRRLDPDSVRRVRVDARSRLVEVDKMWNDAMSEHPSHALLASHWRLSTRRLWEQCTVLVTEADAVGDSPTLDPFRDELVRLTGLLQASLVQIGHWFRTREPHDPLDLPDTEQLRSSLLDRLSETVVEPQSASVPDNLRALAIINSCNLIGERLAEVGAEQTDVIRIAGSRA